MNKIEDKKWNKEYEKGFDRGYEVCLAEVEKMIDEWWNDETILYTDYYLKKLKSKLEEMK